jgi:predicted transposase YbfD/YdcC
MNAQQQDQLISQLFSAVEDPRVVGRTKHLLIDILVIAVMGALCGAESFEDLELFGEVKQEWLQTFLSLPNGIPSHDTFARVFARINPAQFHESFLRWTRAVFEASGGKLVALDGKTIRRSFDKASAQQSLHMVSAWAVENALVLGQLKVEDKSNEITAIPKLLDLLSLKGCTVTIDAMGCQTQIASHIVDKKADYVFCLKGNQSGCLEEVKAFFQDALCSGPKDQKSPMHFIETNDKAHGRIETRRYWQSSDVLWLKEQWKGIQSIGMVEATRTLGEKTSTEKRYFLSSLPLDGQRFSRAVRGHWAIENSLHWCLDVTMNEDKSRIRKGHAAENFALLRKIALNMLKRETTLKASLRGKRKVAGWEPDYLLKLLLGNV